MQGRGGSPTRLPLCPAHRLCRRGSISTIRSVMFSTGLERIRRLPLGPGANKKAGIAEAGEGGQHSD